MVVAARYDSEGSLQLAQVYERRGEVWSDLRLFDRAALMAQLRQRRRVAVGAPGPVPGDFDITDDVRLDRTKGQAKLTTGSGPADHDHLAVPLF